MKKSTSPKRHLFLTKNFILMLVMLVVIIMAVSAWFTFNKTVTADNISVKAASTEVAIAKAVRYTTLNGDTFEVVSDGPGEFKRSIDFDDVLLTKDCTGDGVSFIVPEFNVTNDFEMVRRDNGKDVNDNLQAGEALSDAYVREHEEDTDLIRYIQLEFYVRSKSKEVFANNASCLITRTEDDGHELSVVKYNRTASDGSVAVDKKSAYSSNLGDSGQGAINVDGLAGAVRVSLVGEACNSATQHWELSAEDNKYHVVTARGDNAPTAVSGSAVKQLLWIPRPDIKLTIPKAQGNLTDWSLSLDGSDTTHNYYKRNLGNNGVTKETDSTAVASSGTVTPANCVVSVPSLGSRRNVSTFPEDYTDKNNAPFTIQPVNLISEPYTQGNSETRSYYLYKYTMNVWIEGTDYEARRAMDGGEFRIELIFG